MFDIETFLHMIYLKFFFFFFSGQVNLTVNWHSVCCSCFLSKDSEGGIILFRGFRLRISLKWWKRVWYIPNGTQRPGPAASEDCQRFVSLGQLSLHNILQVRCEPKISCCKKKQQQTKQTGFGNNWLESAYYRLQLSFLWLRAWIFQPLCVLSKRNQTLTHSVPVSTELSELKWMWMLSLTVNIWLYHMSWQTEAVGQRQWLSAWNQAVGSRQLFWKFIQ